MEGGDLSEAIKHDAAGDLTWYNKGQRIALDIARGLHYLHSHDVRFKIASMSRVCCDGCVAVQGTSRCYRFSQAHNTPQLTRDVDDSGSSNRSSMEACVSCFAGVARQLK